METAKRPAELPILSKEFGSDYFNRLYRGNGDKNPAGKIKTYLSIVRSYVLKRTVLSVRKGQSLTENKPKLLDIGCGYGKFLQFAEREFDTVGIDLSDFALRQAGKLLKKTKLVRADVMSYRGENNFYDVITAFDVLEHVPDVEKAILRVKSWLKPEGVLFCVVPVYDGFLGWIAGKLDRDETHINKWSRRQWLGLFQKNFKVLKRWGVIRYSFGFFGYFHFAAPWVFPWGQAILAVMRK